MSKYLIFSKIQTDNYTIKNVSPNIYDIGFKYLENNITKTNTRRVTFICVNSKYDIVSYSDVNII